MGDSESLDAHRVLISLCTFNERDNLASLIPEVLEIVPAADVLVVDDNSPDGTGELVRDLARADPRIHLISRAGKLGLGTASIEAFQFAMERGYEKILNLDADHSHPPRFIPALLEASNKADVVIGSRYVQGGETPGWGVRRRLMSWCINTYARLMLDLPTRDNSGAFRCFRVDKLREIDFSRILSKGYAFQEEILFRCRQVGCSFAEVPITFEDRRFGRTKINWKEAVDAVWILTRLRFERRTRSAPRPAGMIF